MALRNPSVTEVGMKLLKLHELSQANINIIEQESTITAGKKLEPRS